jgi:hypothetical protein
MEVIRMFNKFARANKADIRKALTSATGVGEGLVPEKLEAIITNTMVRLSPEIAVISPKFDNQKRHEFNRLTSLPAPGGAMGEAAVTPTRNATYVRDGVNMKVIRRKGAVTNFLQDASAKYIDASAAEMENHLLAHAFDLATYILWGNATGNQYEFSGLDHLVTTNRINNTTVGGTTPTSLSFLDNMIDRNSRAQGKPHRKVFLMSPEMLSKVSQLLTNVRLNQGLTGAGLSQVEIPGGWRLMAYRDIPIVETMATRPINTMGVIGTATGTTGGTLTDSTTYYFRVAPVTYNGEELASAEVNQATGAPGTNLNTITLSWTAFTGAIGYKVYMGTVSGTLSLVRYISANTYDGSGTITGSTTSIVITAATAGAEIPTAAQTDVPLVQTGGHDVPERVILWDLDEFQGLGKVPYSNSAGDRFNGLVTIKPLAEIDDDIPFLIKSYCALCPSFEATSVIYHNLRTY